MNKLKKFMPVFLILLMVFSLSFINVGCVDDESESTGIVRVINSSSYTIDRVYIESSSNSTWLFTNDLCTGYISSGSSADYEVEVGTWDIRAYVTTDAYAEYYGLSVLEDQITTFTVND